MPGEPGFTVGSKSLPLALMGPVHLHSCDWNRYNIQYALAVSKQRGMKRPSDPLGSEEEADGSDDDDSLHLLSGGHGEGDDKDRLLA